MQPTLHHAGLVQAPRLSLGPVALAGAGSLPPLTIGAAGMLRAGARRAGVAARFVVLVFIVFDLRLHAGTAGGFGHEARDQLAATAALRLALSTSALKLAMTSAMRASISLTRSR